MKRTWACAVAAAVVAASGALSACNGNVGFTIVGAGVSTCAPLEEPQ